MHILDYTGNADDGMEPSSYFAVFDGHFNGAVAEFCGENLHTRIKENSNFSKECVRICHALCFGWAVRHKIEVLKVHLV